VERLAAREGHEVGLSDKLAEGGRLEALLGLLEEVPEGSILCTHGDMLKAVISRFEAEEALQGRACWEKGVVWVLLRVGRRFVRASAIPPLTPKVHALNVVNRVQAAAATSIAAVP
jgi:hypothetical protein